MPAFFSHTALAGDGIVSIENEFIRIRVNGGPNEAGRFAIDTTGGDPSRTSDNEQVLIYGARLPWTSYTTILIDDNPKVFGGPTDRRAGISAPATEIIQPPQTRNNQIITRTRVGDIEITQLLSFARNPTTRVHDSALITYTVKNTGTRECQVGLRVMLDTMLGSNDGAPLRAGDRAVDTATQFTGSEIPDYWQAFDSLSNPAVISQGTLRAPNVAPPDRLEMVDWGTLADAPWEFPFPTNADFTRRGEEVADTAVALYWKPRLLSPGESRNYTTLYGVGGVSLSPAELSLGLTAPAEVDFKRENQQPFSIVAYLENSGGFIARNTRFTLGLSEGLQLAEGSSVIHVGTLEPGQTRQTVWRVLPTGTATGTLQVSVQVTSDNLEPNTVARDIIINSPPQLAISLSSPTQLRVTDQNRYAPNPFEIQARITNHGAQVGRNLIASITLPDGLIFDGEANGALVRERLDPGASTTVSWPIRATGLPTGHLNVSVRATAAGAEPISKDASILIPELTPELRVHPYNQTVPLFTDGQPTLVPVAVKLIPARDFVSAQITIAYDATILEPLYVSRGEGFVESGRLLSPWSAGRLEIGKIVDIGGIRNQAPSLNVAEATLFTVVFMVKELGNSDINLHPTTITSSSGSTTEFIVRQGRLTVRDMNPSEPLN